MVLVGQRWRGQNHACRTMLHLTGATTRLGGHAGTKPAAVTIHKVRRWILCLLLSQLPGKIPRINVLDAPSI